MEYLVDLLYLCPLLLIAGILDGIAGGGGIIALPAYLLTGMPVHSAYACNKLQSGLGTACSAAKYIKAGLVDIKTALMALPFTILGSMAATRLILSLDSAAVKLIVAICIPLAAVLMFAKRRIAGKTVARVGISVLGTIVPNKSDTLNIESDYCPHSSSDPPGGGPPSPRGKARRLRRKLPYKSEFDAKNERELPRFAGSSLSDIIGVRWVSFRRSGRLPRCPYRDLQ